MSEEQVMTALQSDQGLSVAAGTTIQVNANLRITAERGNVLRLSDDENILTGSGFSYRVSGLRIVGSAGGRVNQLRIEFGGDRQAAVLTMSGTAGKFGIRGSANGTMTFGNGIDRNPTACRIRALGQNITSCNQ